MNRFKQNLLRRLVAEQLMTFQLPALLKLIDDEHARIFYEDNEPTRRAHIVESLPRRVADWPKPTQKKWRVASPVTTDYMGNICINPHDQTGRMFVAPQLVEITYD